jgi:hypothetical protein
MILKNSTAAPGTNKHRLIVFAKHLLIWVAWYGVSSLEIIGYRQPLTALFWGHLCYDFSSLVLVFYGTAFFVKQWFDVQHRQQLNAPAAGNGFWRQAHTAWGAVLAILTGYVALSVFKDRMFPIDTPSLLLDHIDKRLNRVLPYVTAAIMYGHFRSQKEWYDALLEEADTRLEAIRYEYIQYSSFADRLCSRSGDAVTDTLHLPTEWETNIPAPAAKSPLTIIALHSLLWVGWFALHSLGFIVYGHTFRLLDWLLIGFDYGMLVAVFYGIAFCIKKYFLSQERLRQWIRIELFAALAILGSYIALSVYLSQRFPLTDHPVTSFVYAWRYFNYSLPYAMVAVMYSYFGTRIQLKRKNLRDLNGWGETAWLHNVRLHSRVQMLKDVLTIY